MCSPPYPSEDREWKEDNIQLWPYIRIVDDWSDRLEDGKSCGGGSGVVRDTRLVQQQKAISRIEPSLHGSDLYCTDNGLTRMGGSRSILVMFGAGKQWGEQ